MDLTLFLTHRCNLACTYCYGGSKFDRTMDHSLIQKGVDFAFSSGHVRISFFGGEPFLAFEKMRFAVEYANRISAQRGIPIDYSVTTNGTLWNDEIAAFLKENRFHLAVSIDGVKASHDITRPRKDGTSAYPIVQETLRRAVSTLPSVETISVIDPDNVSRLSQGFLALLSTGVGRLSFNINTRADWSDPALERLASALGELSAEYVDQYRCGTRFALDIIDHKIITHLKGGYAGCDRCRFGEGELCLTPKGNLYPCERVVGEDDTAELVIGHIDTGVDRSKVARLVSAKDRLEDECRACRYRHRCMHWCGCVNFETTGRVGSTSAAVCRTEQLIIEAADRAAERLFKERNPLFLSRFYLP